MISKWLVGLVAGASLLGARASAADNVKFDQGVDAQGALSSLQGKTYSVTSAFVAHAMGFRPHLNGPARDYKNYSDFSPSQAIPDTFDLRPRLTQIEDQGNCGSCWAFSLTATNRDGHALGAGDPGRLSQEWLIENSKEAAGCNGGDFDSANDLVTPGGQPLWSACPYATGSGACAATMTPAASIASWHMLGDQQNGPSVRDIETYMSSSGKPVSIAIAAGSGDWQSYAGGIYNGCTAGQLDHMINIAGWDNEGATFDAKGNLPPGKGVWILRNSWGTSWGENGYMRMRMTDSSGARCNNVAEQAAYFDMPAK